MAAADDAQNLFDHYDTYWFTHQIFKKTQNNNNPHPQTQKSIVETDQNLDFHSDVNNTNDTSILLVDSIKQQQLIQSDSLNSVLNLYNSPKLETIFSGKESRVEILEEKEPAVKVKKAPVSRPKERKKNSSGKKSKSLSELEFEELKGFMDLGFLFSEKDKDSKLVSIIPGLQRLGKSDWKDEQAAVVDDDDHHHLVSSRPYLSEAWDEIDNKRELEPLIIRIPAAFGNEVEIKDQLKCWAHSVAASVVR